MKWSQGGQGGGQGVGVPALTLGAALAVGLRHLPVQLAALLIEGLQHLAEVVRLAAPLAQLQVFAVQLQSRARVLDAVVGLTLDLQVCRGSPAQCGAPHVIPGGEKPGGAVLSSPPERRTQPLTQEVPGEEAQGNHSLPWDVEQVHGVDHLVLGHLEGRGCCCWRRTVPRAGVAMGPPAPQDIAGLQGWGSVLSP